MKKLILAVSLLAAGRVAFAEDAEQAIARTLSELRGFSGLSEAARRMAELPQDSVAAVGRQDGLVRERLARVDRLLHSLADRGTKPAPAGKAAVERVRVALDEWPPSPAKDWYEKLVASLGTEDLDALQQEWIALQAQLTALSCFGAPARVPPKDSSLIFAPRSRSATVNGEPSPEVPRKPRPLVFGAEFIVANTGDKPVSLDKALGTLRNGDQVLEKDIAVLTCDQGTGRGPEKAAWPLVVPPGRAVVLRVGGETARPLDGGLLVDVRLGLEADGKAVEAATGEFMVKIPR